jgi:hypothetical protein
MFEILPVKKPKDDDVYNSIKEPLPKPPFNALLYAPVNSGKSNLIINLLYREGGYTKKVFTGGVFFFSPNVNNDSIFDNNISMDDDIVKFDTDLEYIDHYVQEIVKRQQEVPKKDRQPMLLIFDDCLGYINPRGYISKFSTRNRQLKISMLFTIQVFRAIPNFIRVNCKWIIFFKTHNEDEKKKILEEMNMFPNFQEFYDLATKEKYSFLFANLKDRVLYKKFEQLMWEEGNETEDKDP